MITGLRTVDLVAPRVLFALGIDLRTLSRAAAGEKLGGENNLLEILQRTATALDDLKLAVSSEVFKNGLTPIIEKLVKAVQGDPDATIDADLAQRLATEATMLIPAVSAECKTSFIAQPVSARFGVGQLLTAPDTLLASGAFVALPPIAQTDFKEASACLAFGLSTAAAFHALRCVEECVRWLHRSYYPSEKQNKPWSPLLKQLENKPRKPRPDAGLLKRLDHLREHFRNPTQHPELVYDHDQAQELFHLCIEAVSSCARDPRIQARGLKRT
jgi:hypothetical protein